MEELKTFAILFEPNFWFCSSCNHKRLKSRYKIWSSGASSTAPNVGAGFHHLIAAATTDDECWPNVG